MENPSQNEVLFDFFVPLKCHVKTWTFIYIYISIFHLDIPISKIFNSGGGVGKGTKQIIREENIYVFNSFARLVFFFCLLYTSSLFLPLICWGLREWSLNNDIQGTYFLGYIKYFSLPTQRVEIFRHNISIYIWNKLFCASFRITSFHWGGEKDSEVKYYRAKACSLEHNSKVRKMGWQNLKFVEHNTLMDPRLPVLSYVWRKNLGPKLAENNSKWQKLK